jgi:predicted DNA-binding transcriptional regulator YafY
MTRHQPLVRCLRLARYLEGRRYLPTLDAMAHELRVHQRTVRRYVAALEEAQWPVPAPRPKGHECDDAPFAERAKPHIASLRRSA